jgi:hypothetical protein
MDAIYQGHELLSLASLYSDHAPLLLRTNDDCQVKKRFHFWGFWPCFPGFAEVDAQAWHCSLGNVSPFARLDWLLHNTSRFLNSWNDRQVGNFKT